MPTTITDVEFGEVTVRRSSLARYVRVKIGQDGRLSASLPHRTPLKLVSKLIDQSRDELRSVISEFRSIRPVRSDGQRVGQSHTLHIKYSSTTIPKSHIAHQQITVYLPMTMNPESVEAQKFISDVTKKTLRKEAESYLPRRVKHLAAEYGFSISTIRFNNAKTRWGSCSSTNSINLNIALMQVRPELIDYVIVHELCHTKHMDHSAAFWSLVQQFCPSYKTLRAELKKHTPHI